MVEQPYLLRPAVQAELEKFGLQPNGRQAPALLRDVVKELYLFEVRRLRNDLIQAEGVSGRGARRDYLDRLHALREKYRILSFPVEHWLERKSS